MTAVDRDLTKIRADGQTELFELFEHDLEEDGWPFGSRLFGGIVVTNYLYRPILQTLISALDRGGVLIYDTFAAGNERFGKPANPDYLLQPAELLVACAERMHVIAYDHGRTEAPHPAIRQRICARRRQ